MFSIINENGRANYGIIDKYPIDFNYQDYRLLDFFDREIEGFKKKWKFHKLNYLGLISDKYILGLAMTDLSYCYNCFVYLYDFKEGLLFDHKVYGMFKKQKQFDFPANPDKHSIAYSKGKNGIDINKNFLTSELFVNCNLGNRFSFAGQFYYDFNLNRPLRVLCPAGQNGWSFTEKASLIKPDFINVELDDKELKFDLSNTTLFYNWSAGYYKRETEWYWIGFSGYDKEENLSIGGNFAAFTNETYYSENVLWLDGERYRFGRVIFDYDPLNPMHEWKAFNENGIISLTFTPYDEMKEMKKTRFLKTFFRQFPGEFSGYFQKPKGEKVHFSGIKGFGETKRTRW
ncbi:hypothetical protein SYNTR_1810 [Candidatus Syntrophocurvum alkaliphilum]|uniref:DUF2804 domain-containing protein n=1 Tax=Candidatus Syntrophocurvum alkaliphilum TaxID=2293317 RepID=A0A6I6DHH9_9FIRM|nr:DUF2804 domain-containing protein [Candidatus Syntrophocurvum alkaliphilum]QGU00404.1 hypothetical protein SYNTR_1810 [Candidatus Syntrophocurvum alkaliphilum]